MRKLYAMLALFLGVHYANGQCTGGTLLPASGYNENFNSGAGGWTASGANSTWVLGNQTVFSQKAVINTPFGSTGNSWVTSDTASTSSAANRNKYKNSENSFVTSPCLNMTNIPNPVIRIKIWYQSESPSDGAALQYSTNNGATWQSVGSLNDPDNWYNVNVSSKPGGQNAGWSGNSNGWVTAQHDLTGTGGQTGVLLRFAFKSDFLFNADGFAFDNIEIFNKPNIDLGVVAINAPSSGCGATDTTPVTISIKNFGAVTQSNIPVSYSFTGQQTGGTGSPETIPGPIGPGATITYTFTQRANLLQGGTYNFNATVSQPGDAQTSNNTFTGYSVTNITAISTFPYRENFENTATSSDWASGGTNSSWALGNPAKSIISGAASGVNAWVTGRTGTHNANEKSYVESRCFDFSQLILPVIEMKVWWDSDIEDGAVLQASTDGGITWKIIGNYNDPNNWYNNNTILGAPGNQPIGWSGRMGTTTPAGSNGWVLAKHDLPTLGQKKNVKFRIAFGSNASTNYDGFAFDDIFIYDKPEVEIELTRILQPFSGCQLSSQEFVAFELKNNGSRTQYNIPVVYDFTGPQNGNATIIVDSLVAGQTKGFLFTNSPADLSQQGVYSFTVYVSQPNDINRLNDTVRNFEVSNIQVVVTPNNPYLQNFENNRGGWEARGSSSTWAYGTPAKAIIRGAASGSKAWVTGGLGTGTYNPNEFSYVESPCMNFSNITNPVIQMKVWWASETNKDGAVLQYSVNGPAGPWVTVGALNDPNNWYNSNNLDGNPGAQKLGWSGEGQRSSNGWVVAQHNLTGLGGNNFVTLRIAFGSNGTNQLDGFAFDDVAIFQKPATDVAIISLPPIPQNCGFTNCEKIRVEIHNNGSTPIFNIPVSYKLGNNATVTQTFSDTIAVGMKTTLQFTACADLSAIGSHPVTVTVNYPNDQLNFNNTFSTVYQNALFNTLPLKWTFESNSQNTFNEFKIVTNNNSSTYVSSLAGNNSATGLVMDGGSNMPWTDPVGAINPWLTNLDHLAGIYFCVDLSGTINPQLSFDLKQVTKSIFSNTNFRVTVNGVQDGTSYQPPVNMASTWNRIVVDLTPYKNLGIARIGLESSVRESYKGGAGHGNLVDSIVVAERTVGLSENLNSDNIYVFPNPTTGKFQVAINSDLNQIYKLEVVDLSGRVIKTSSIDNNTNQTLLDLSENAKGIYILKIIGRNSISTKKLIVY